MSSGLTLGIIGVGNLGGALAEGALAAGAVSKVMAADISTVRLNELKARIGLGFAIGSAPLVGAVSDIVVVAVKPHVVSAVLEEIRDELRPGCPLVSVAAGVQIKRIQSSLRSGWPVVRAMPNLAMLVRESATALYANRFVTQQGRESVESVFRAVGRVVWVQESQMHAVTGLTGSGPAYVSLLIEGLAAGGVKMGLQPPLARELACQLLYGTAKLLIEKDLHPAVLIDQVTTPGGTTIAGLKELELQSVRGALLAAVEAATERSEELAES